VWVGPSRLQTNLDLTPVAVCCSPPPAGRARWTMSLLADELVGRKLVVSICRETVRLALKKTRVAKLSGS
jgi:hypothetical protein